MHVVNTFRTSKGPPTFCIDLEADWPLIVDEVGGKSPGWGQNRDGGIPSFSPSEENSKC